MFYCYCISMRSADDTIDFKAETTEDALKQATRRCRTDKGWQLRFDREREQPPADALEGLKQTWRNGHWMLYIHSQSQAIRDEHGNVIVYADDCE